MDGLDQLAAALINGAPDGVVVSQRGTILFANAAAASMLGYSSPEELAGVSLLELLDPEDGREMQRRTELMVKAGERFAPRAYRALRQDGGRISAEISSVLFQWKGEPAVLAFARDVSVRVRSQAQLAATDRLAAVGALAAGVAHEITNPMTAVTLGLQAIARVVDRDVGRLPGGAAVRVDLTSLVEDLEASAKQVVDIVKDLRRFARIGREVRMPVSISDVLENAERLVTHTLDAHVKLSGTHAPIPNVLGIAARLEHVAVNLLLHAAQAIPIETEGLISVRTLVAADGRAGFEVSSNGVGFSREDLPHIFEPFYVTAPAKSGNGLGLAISHNIVCDLGGELQVESPGGQGSTFRVLLPTA